MPERHSSKYNVPASNYPTPSWGSPPQSGISAVDELLIEYVEPNKEGYVKLPEGTRHPDTVNFPNHRLLKEEFVDYGTNRRFWGNGFRNQDQYNYDINYSGESNSHPIFQRRYLERRDQYSVISKGAKFTGVFLIEVVFAGSGYDPEVPPTVSITGGGGAGATAQALVGSDGSISWIYITNEGSGYTSAPSISFSSGAAVALAKVNIDTQVVSSVTIAAAGTGSGYSSAPTVSFSGGGGSGATATAQVLSGKVRAIMVTQNGLGYTSAPSVIFTGGGGTGASGTAVLETISIQLVKEEVSQLGEDDPRRSLYVLVTRTYEALPGPVLFEHKYVPFLQSYARVRKRIVSASIVPEDQNFVTAVGGQITEYQPITKWRYVQIISNISSLLAWENGGADLVYYGTANYSFPNEIHDAPVIDVVEAHSTTSSGTTLTVDFGWKLNVIEGYSGPCRAKYTRRITFDPTSPAFQAALPVVTPINPQSDVINERFAYSGGNLIAKANQFIVPSSLHPRLEVTVDTHGSSVITALEPPVAVIEATVPEGLPSGTEIVVSVKPEQYDFGIWIFNIVSIYVP